MSRDWMQTLWKTSFKGATFWVDGDEESGGRRVAEHLFPNGDVPYLEDLGEDLRKFEITAYLASDNADVDAVALTAAMVSKGPGILVMAMQGPVYVRNISFKRNRSKDKHGYVGYTLNLTREGAASALVSVNYLANQIYDAVGALAGASAAAFASDFVVSSQGGVSPQPVDFVVAAAVDGLRTGVSVVDAIRATATLDPAVNSAQRLELQATYDAIPEMLESLSTVSDAPAAIFSSALAVGYAMDAKSAMDTFSAVLTDTSMTPSAPALYPTANLRAEYVNSAAAFRAARMAAMGAYAEAIARLVIPDRQTGITIRANVAEFFEAETIDLPLSAIELTRAIDQLADRIADYLSKTIVNLAPVNTVETNISMPSLALAWTIYQDPNRAPEIVARNKVLHPSFMPTKFEALAPAQS